MNWTCYPSRAVCFLLCLAGAISTAQADIFQPDTGLPDVDLLSGEPGGKRINLQSLKGKKTVLFIFASW